MADYSLLGSFSTGGASALNGDLLTKLKDAEKQSVLFNIDPALEDITGLDAETGDTLDTIGESDTLMVIKAQALDLMGKISSFDLGSTSTTAFDAVSASTTGDAAVFDAVDVGGLEPGTTNISVSQLAQKDVYQSATITEAENNAGIPIDSDASVAIAKSSKLTIDVGDKTYDFNFVVDADLADDTITDVADLGFKGFEDLAAEINAKDELIASVEQVGTEQYRLVIKSAEAGVDNALKITETNTSLGFDNETMKSKTEVTSTDEMSDVLIVNDKIFTANEVQSIAVSGTVDDGASASGEDTTVSFLGHDVTTQQDDSAAAIVTDILSQKNSVISTWNTNNAGQEIKDIIANPTDSSSLVIIYENATGDANTIGASSGNNGIDFAASADEQAYAASYTYNDMIDEIDGDADFTAQFIEDDDTTTTDVGTIQIASATSTDLSINEYTTGLDFINAGETHVQVAQNLNANIDGIDYNTASNTVTIQGNLTMTAVKLGDATIDIQKDTSAIVSGVESLLESYNSLVDLIDDATQTADSVMNDTSSLRSMLSSIKEQLFGSYGENGDLNLFNYGLDLDIQGKLSLDTTKFGEALVDNYDDVKNLFMGNTTDTDTATSDSTKYLGLGTALQDYLDALDGSDGLITRYEASIATRQEKLEEERTAALETLDTKYESMAAQFSQYGSLITQMESSFSGLSMMIQQSVASK